MKDHKEQNNEYSLRDFLFELPFIANGSEPPTDWGEKEVKLFKAKIVEACNEIIDDTAPVNSPAGKYRAQMYGEFKRCLLKAIETYKGDGNKDTDHVWLICQWALRELGWGSELGKTKNKTAPWEQIDGAAHACINSFIDNNRFTGNNAEVVKAFLISFEIRSQEEYGRAYLGKVAPAVDEVIKHDTYPYDKEAIGKRSLGDRLKDYWDNYRDPSALES